MKNQDGQNQTHIDARLPRKISRTSDHHALQNLSSNTDANFARTDNWKRLCDVSRNLHYSIGTWHVLKIMFKYCIF
jgi:hypothetical protein